MNRIRRIIGGHLLLNLARAAGLIGVFALCFPLQCWAQTYTITTFAGGGTPYPGKVMEVRRQAPTFSGSQTSR